MKNFIDDLQSRKFSSTFPEEIDKYMTSSGKEKVFQNLKMNILNGSSSEAYKIFEFFKFLIPIIASLFLKVTAILNSLGQTVGSFISGGLII